MKRGGFIHLKNTFILPLILYTISGCQASGIPITPVSVQHEIDWVDFIIWDGQEFIGIHSGVIADEAFIGEVIGQVKYKVADVVTNSHYKTKNGDAAFHEIGTDIYSVKDHPELIAVKDTEEVNGYILYYASERMDFKWHFRDVKLDEVSRVEIYESYTTEGNKLVSVLAEPDKLQRFRELIEESSGQLANQPYTAHDPTHFEMALYTSSPIAYKFNIQYDGSNYYWYPWDTAVFSEELEELLFKEKQ
jgi:hypothetical protein